MILWLIKKLFRFTSEQQRHELLTLAVKDLYTTISSKDVLREDHLGVWHFKGKPLLPEMRNVLISEAQILIKSKLFEILNNDLKDLANSIMFTRSKDIDDMIAGKLLLYLTDVVGTRVKSMARGSGRFNKPTL